MTPNFHVQAMQLNLHMIRSYLGEAERDIQQAIVDLREGNQNAAIGAILELPDRLEASKTLCDAVMRIHRNCR
jgi:hypothetical protein